MIIVGKATQELSNGGVDYVELFMREFKQVQKEKGYFAYAWSFNPDPKTIDVLRANLPTWLYLIGNPWFSPLRVRIVDFRHDRYSLSCPIEWQSYCISELLGIDEFEDDDGAHKKIHIFFLVDKIEEVSPSLEVRHLTPFFSNKYRMYGRNFFGFFRQPETYIAGAAKSEAMPSEAKKRQ